MTGRIAKINESYISDIKLKHNFDFAKYLLDSETVKYYTWVYKNELNIYYDIVLTEKRIIMIGNDCVTSYIYKQISDIMIYHGNDEEYPSTVFHWYFGSSGMLSDIYKIMA